VAAEEVINIVVCCCLFGGGQILTIRTSSKMPASGSSSVCV
jgi:hypothetical protein